MNQKEFTKIIEEDLKIGTNKITKLYFKVLMLKYLDKNPGISGWKIKEETNKLLKYSNIILEEINISNAEVYSWLDELTKSNLIQCPERQQFKTTNYTLSSEGRKFLDNFNKYINEIFNQFINFGEINE